MDVMREYEIGAMIDCIPYTDVNIWETTRLRIMCSSQMFSKNKLTPTDIMSFPWDKRGVKEDVRKDITNDEISMMNDKVKDIQSKYYGKLHN